jgi:hypothetical protein
MQRGQGEEEKQPRRKIQVEEPKPHTAGFLLASRAAFCLWYYIGGLAA